MFQVCFSDVVMHGEVQQLSERRSAFAESSRARSTLLRTNKLASVLSKLQMHLGGVLIPQPDPRPALLEIDHQRLI